MTIKELFINEVVNEVKLIVGDNAEVRCGKVVKLNGVVLHGITIIMPGEKMAPKIYIENYIKDHVDARDVAKQIITDAAKQREDFPEIKIEEYMNYEYCKNKLSVRLINYGANREMLKDIPHIKFLDLAMICYVNMSEDTCFRVNKYLLEKFGITIKKLFEEAKANTQKLLPAYGTDIINIVFGTEETKNDIDPIRKDMMYVLSNKEKYFGATTMLYDGLLDKLAMEVEMDLIIIPSSVHEVILVTYESGVDIEYLKESVSYVNGNDVREDEILSDNVYLYKRETKQIKIL